MAKIPDSGLENVRQRLQDPAQVLRAFEHAMSPLNKFYQPILDAGKRVGMRAVGASTQGTNGLALIIGEYHHADESARQFTSIVKELQHDVQGTSYVLEGPPGVYCFSKSVALENALAALSGGVGMPALEQMVYGLQWDPTCIPLLVQDYAVGKKPVVTQNDGYDVVMWPATRPEVTLRDHWVSHNDRVRFADHPMSAQTQREATDALCEEAVRRDDLRYTLALTKYIRSFVERDRFIAHAIASEASSAPVICKVGVAHIVGGALLQQLPRYGVSYIALAPDVENESMIIPPLQ